MHLTVYRKDAGKTGRCPGCNALLRVPADAFSHETDGRHTRACTRRTMPAAAEGRDGQQEKFQALGTSAERTDPNPDF